MVKSAPRIPGRSPAPGRAGPGDRYAAAGGPRGDPPLTVRLAREPGSSVVDVRVEGAMDPVLAARVETLLDVL